MDDRKKDFLPDTPGIPEALHPELGNGSLLARDRHTFLLRSPDPLKSLDSLLFEEVAEPAKLVTSKPLTEDLAAEAEPAKPSRKPKTPARRKTPEPGDTPTGSPEPTEPLPAPVISKAKPAAEKAKAKPPKPGKRLRKAAKAVQQQEKKEKAPSPDTKPAESKSADIPLSPFTQWLKGLSGSDYVHPYDDDFAIGQSPGQAREGMSETYADLLAAQGHVDRAREMYLRLMEKYPEKSGFFAAKIKALE